MKFKEQILSDEKFLTIIDTKNIICKEQILHAIHQTSFNFEQNLNSSKEWGIEFILNLSASSRIEEALNLFDVNESTIQAFLISTSELPDNVISGFPEFTPEHDTLKKYGVNDQNLDLCLDVISQITYSKIK